MSRPYRPRRFSKKWNEGAPAAVLDVFDDEKMGDRYTIFFTFPYAFSVHNITGEVTPKPGHFAETYIPYFGTDGNPTHPQGVGYWGEMTAYSAALYRYENGHRRIKWADLPEKVKSYIINFIALDQRNKGAKEA